MSGVVRVVVGNPKAGGRTTAAGIAVAEALCAESSLDDVEVLELEALAPVVLGWGDPEVTDTVAKVLDSAALVVASPTYKASFTGLLKAFLDHFDAGSLTGIPTVPVMLGGGQTHALAVETQLRPVLVELGASMPTRGLYLVDREMEQVPGIIESWAEEHRSVLRRLLP